MRPATIRPVAVTDADAVVALAAELALTSRQTGEASINLEHMDRTVRTWLQRPLVAFVAEEEQGLVGMVAFAICEHPISGERRGSEVCWWVSPDARGRVGLALLQAAEAELKAHHVTRILMESPADDPGFGRLLARHGYAPVQVTYERRI